MERIIAAIIGAFVGAALKHLYDRYADRSEPIGSLLRIGLTTSVPQSAKDVVASFPRSWPPGTTLIPPFLVRLTQRRKCR